MLDRLAALLDQFGVSARSFQAGALCGINGLDAIENQGQLHLIREGEVEVHHSQGAALRISEPSLLLYPRPMSHRFVSDTERGAHFVCAHLRFEGGDSHPIAAALPAFVHLPLAQLQDSDSLLQLLFSEAASSHCGRQAVLDRLFEVLLIQILRVVMELGQLRSGMLAGMGHAQLRRALIAMHERPQQAWSLGELAAEAGMSRTVFAKRFHELVGSTPGAYLQAWRISLVQKQLREGQALKHIAAAVGYGSEAALSRAFSAQVGRSPREWRKASLGEVI